MLKEMILDFNSYIKENITEDKLLLEGLLNHIKPTIYRIKNKIELENSIYKEVLESYPNYFNITKAVLKKIEDKMNLTFTEDEISFLVIHFKAAIDRNKVKSKKKRVVLVCGLGYGTSKLLAQQLNQYYYLEIVDIIPEYLIDKVISKNDIDLILTTVDVDEYLIDDFFQEKNTIFGYLEERILINQEVKDWKEAIRKVGQPLLKGRIIKESYIENSIKPIKEFGSYMVLGTETLFPHARIKGDVFETGFSVMMLKTPVLLPINEKIYTIIIFSSKNNNDYLETFIKLVDLSNEESFLQDVNINHICKKMIRVYKTS
ncbi:MAG: BglG family transcription antiterminator [Cetobacterium sp.]